MATTETATTQRAFLLNGTGGGTEISREELNAWSPENGPLWVQFDPNHDTVESWLRNDSGLEEAACDALMASETRPRCTAIGDGLLIILRGVNLNPGSDPEDMISIRLWVDCTRMISRSPRCLMAVSDMIADVERGSGPKSTADLLSELTRHLLQRMAPTLSNLDDAVDALEEKALSESPNQLQSELAELRHQVIALRRHLVPQRDAMNELVKFTAKYFDEDHRAIIQDLAEKVTRYVEGLDELRERTAVTHDLLSGRQAEAMNGRMLVLSLITAVFLPLGLLTGLLGINVGGIPGSDNSSAFAIVCGLLIVLAVLQLLALKMMKWF